MTAGLTGGHVPWSPKEFLSTILVNTYLMRCIRYVSDIKALTNRILLLKKSVCIVRVKVLEIRFLVGGHQSADCQNMRIIEYLLVARHERELG